MCSRVIVPTRLAEQNQTFVSHLGKRVGAEGTHDNGLASLLRIHVSHLSPPE